MVAPFLVILPHFLLVYSARMMWGFLEHDLLYFKKKMKGQIWHSQEMLSLGILEAFVVAVAWVAPTPLSG